MIDCTTATYMCIMWIVDSLKLMIILMKCAGQQRQHWNSPSIKAPWITQISAQKHKDVTTMRGTEPNPRGNPEARPCCTATRHSRHQQPWGKTTRPCCTTRPLEQGAEDHSRKGHPRGKTSCQGTKIPDWSKGHMIPYAMGSPEKRPTAISQQNIFLLTSLNRLTTNYPASDYPN